MDKLHIAAQLVDSWTRSVAASPMSVQVPIMGLFECFVRWGLAEKPAATARSALHCNTIRLCFTNPDATLFASILGLCVIHSRTYTYVLSSVLYIPRLNACFEFKSICASHWLAYLNCTAQCTPWNIFGFSRNSR